MRKRDSFHAARRYSWRRRIASSWRNTTISSSLNSSDRNRRQINGGRVEARRSISKCKVLDITLRRSPRTDVSASTQVSTAHAAFGSIPRWSLTADCSRCLRPRHRSAVRIETGRSKRSNLGREPFEQPALFSTVRRKTSAIKRMRTRRTHPVESWTSFEWRAHHANSS